MCVFETIKSSVKVNCGFATIIFLVLMHSAGRANAPLPRFESTKSVPLELGSFRLIGDAKQLKANGTDAPYEAAKSDYLKLITEARYTNARGVQLQVSSFTWETDSAAYANFTYLRKGRALESDTPAARVGTASAVIERGILFFKGTNSVKVISENESNPALAVELARLFAATLDDGENDIPVLLKHLPNWESVQRGALYAVDDGYLRNAVPNQPVLDAINFDGGTEAVIANYGQSQLVIVEFTTPQFSIENDQRIWTKIGELKSKGQPGPTAYRRVGNYSVFVFNAPDEKTANDLVAQVKYEQVVQWLGEDPHIYERLQRYFTQTSAGVLVAVLKSSGLSLLLCLAAGALIGTMMFRHRRAEKAAAYSDAGGSIRLNLDDLTGPANARRLLESAESSKRNSGDS